MHEPIVSRDTIRDLARSAAELGENIHVANPYPAGTAAALTAQELRSVLSYDPSTGVFTWVKRTTRRIHVGDIAGHLDCSGYIHIRVFGVLHKAHRLAILYVSGSMPFGEVDHINCVRSDNRFTNLRDVGGHINRQNHRRPYSNNYLGILGVTTMKSGGFRAAIRNNRVSIHLGCFSTPDEAHAAYTNAKRDLHAGCTL